MFIFVGKGVDHEEYDFIHEEYAKFNIAFIL